MFRTDLRKQDAPLIKPDRYIELDRQLSGQWIVMGDITGNGEHDLVSARNDDQAVTTICAYELSGNLLWSWGEAGAGGANLTYDVPLQIYDINGKGNSDVYFSTYDYLVHLDGKTGEEIEKFKLPDGLRTADCIAFANLSGERNGRASDIIIKSRYRNVWAYTKDWDLLWSWKPFFRHKTCHYPTIVDLDGDGFEEVLAGRKMLNNDGSTLWKIKSRKTKHWGHLDAARIAIKGDTPAETRIIFTYCGAKYIAYMTGTGKILWEDRDLHFESIDVGTFNSDHPSPQFYVDIDHTPFGEAKGLFYDAEGNKFGKVCLNYGRQHRSIDWNGNGLDEVIIANTLAIIDGNGKKVASLEFKGENGSLTSQEVDRNTHLHMGIWDITGKGNGDVGVYSPGHVCIYENPSESTEKNKRI